MRGIIYPIGDFASKHVWFNETLDEILVESLFIYVVLQTCCAVGLFGIFAKLNSKKWLAFVPGVNMARLGDLCGSIAAGFVIALCKLAFLVLAEATVRVYTIPLIDKEVVNYHCGMTVLLTALVLLVRTAAGYWLYRKLIRRFAESSSWLISFLLFPNITTLFFGFNPNIRE